MWYLLSFGAFYISDRCGISKKTIVHLEPKFMPRLDLHQAAVRRYYLPKVEVFETD